MKPNVMAIRSPTTGNHEKNAAMDLYRFIFCCTAMIFSFFTLNHFSNHCHLPRRPSQKEVMPPKVLPIPAKRTHSHTSLPKAMLPNSRASLGKGNIVEARKLPMNSPHSPEC